MGHIYLYGIIDSGNEANFGVAGVDGSSAVYSVTHGDTGSVVSDHQGEAFTELSKEDLVRCLLAHQRVVEHVMRNHTVLPVKFGTLLDNPEEVHALLFQCRQEFVDAFVSIQDKVEVEVAATWDTNSVLRQVALEEEVIRAREAITQKGQPPVEDRLKLGQLVHAYVEKHRLNYQQQMMDFLKPLSVEVASNALVSDEMVMNVAFLVDRARQREFDDDVQRLDGLLRSEVNFRVIGPLPPYSFSTVGVERITQEQVEAARQRLEMEEVISDVDVRRAYRRLAAKAHRDLTPMNGSVEDRLAGLRHASQLLLRYCQAHSRDHMTERHHAPASQDTDCLFAISTKGSRAYEVEPARFGALVRV